MNAGGFIYYFYNLALQDVIMTCGLEKSTLSAKGGIIGGQIELQNLKATCKNFGLCLMCKLLIIYSKGRLTDPADREPLHKLCVHIDAMEGRIEYMGTICMMGQLTNANLELGDEWLNPTLSLPSNSDKKYDK